MGRLDNDGLQTSARTAMSGDWFVYALMVLNVGASVTYAWHGHGWKACYWATVALLNLCLLRLK